MSAIQLPVKIAFLTSDISTALIGPYLFARALAGVCETEIWGPCSTGRIWEPLDGLEVTCRPLAPWYSQPGRFWRQARRLRCDVLYAFSPAPLSFGLGLLLRRWLKVPLILYLEELESAYHRELRPFERLSPRKLADHAVARGLESLVRRADAVHCSSSFLQRRLGGVRIPQGCDTDVVSPARYPRQACRARLGLDGELRYVLFQGSLMRHKGVEDLLLAFRRIENPRWRLLIVGGCRNRWYLRRLRRLAASDPRVLLRSKVPYAEAHRYLAASDLVVIPHRNTEYARSQVPVKLYHAMAMGKAVLATKVSDIPEVLGGCGFLVEPRRVEALAEALKAAFADPGLCRRMGERARERCVRRYGFSRMRALLLASLEAARRRFARGRCAPCGP